MTWTETSVPTWPATSAPASVAAFTAPTSPLMMTATSPSPTCSRPMMRDVGGLHHGVRRGERRHIALGLDHSDCIARHVSSPVASVLRYFLLVAEASSMEPMISASMGGALPGNHAAATEPVATMTFSPSPQPSGSKARSFGARVSSTCDLENGAGWDLAEFLGGPDAARDGCLEHQRLLSILRPSCRALSRASGVSTASAPRPASRVAGEARQCLLGDDALAPHVAGALRRCGGGPCASVKRSFPARTASCTPGPISRGSRKPAVRRRCRCGRSRAP